MPQNTSQTATGRYNVSNVSSWPPERWVTIIVLGALGALIAVRMGFRGVNVLGARVSV